ncbi:MAG: ribosome maturation factor RimM [Candidatus Binatia bacterium]
MATVARAHGVRGELIVYADPSLRSVLHVGVEIRLATTPRYSAHRIIKSSPHNRGVRLLLDGIDSREHAQALTGVAVMVDRAALPELGDGEYYDFELIGNRVVTAEGEELGVITQVVATGANDVYVVKSDAGEILVPAASGAVLSIDRESHRVIVEATALEYSGSSRSPK